MTDYQAPVSDLNFLLFQVFKVDATWSSWPSQTETDRATAEAVLDEAGRFCQNVLGPLDREADEQGCRLADGEVITPDGFKQAYRAYNDAGWGGLDGNREFGAMGLPKSLVAGIQEMVQGACMSFGLAPMLTSGACQAIDAHGSASQRSFYLPRLYSGEWSAAMDLTEPHAGTDLGLMRTRAEPQSDGSYLITGSKIFITWGEHDMSENIVHLVLAKLPDAPGGSKGISMFLVPKFLPTASGGPGERNRLACGALEKKMGIKGSATCVMNFDGATGWLLGQPHQGLAAMFTMMNHERLAVGIQAIGVAETSYRTALSYARERLQGRSPRGAQNSGADADPLLVHPDVRRMLLTMKAWIEGSRASYLYAAGWLDMADYAPQPELQEQGRQMASLLTPVVKAFASDVAFESAVLGQQVLGGHGYVREWGQEQKVRDIRITQIYEGTNGIQALDLIGRKTVANQGGLLGVFKRDVEAFLTEQRPALDALELNRPLEGAMAVLQQATDEVLSQSGQDPCAPGAAAQSYLHLFGHVLYAFLWARMACTAHQSPGSASVSGKIKTARFYFDHLLPRIHGLAASIEAGAESMMEVGDEEF